MGRGKVQLKKIENRTNRQVTFCKRKNGLLKKACELSLLCDAEVALIIFSATGKLYEFSSNSMERTIQNYKDIHDQKMHPDGLVTHPDVQNLDYWRDEARKLREQSDSLAISIRQLMGDSLQSLSISDLQNLENRVEKGLGCVRTSKEELLFEKIENLQTRIEETQGCTSRTEVDSLGQTDEQNFENKNLEKSPECSNSNGVVIQTALQL